MRNRNKKEGKFVKASIKHYFIDVFYLLTENQQCDMMKTALK